MNSTERITAATLAQATAQQVFDQSVGGVIAQGRRCIDENGKCVYRKANGDACAAGQLLSDDEAHHADTISHTGVIWIGVIRKGIASEAHRDLIQYLQHAHNDLPIGEHFIEGFTDRARNIAHKFNLDTSIINR